jgi:hypothetical protein
MARRIGRENGGDGIHRTVPGQSPLIMPARRYPGALGSLGNAGYHRELQDAETIGVTKIGAPEFVIIHSKIVTSTSCGVR